MPEQVCVAKLEEPEVPPSPTVHPSSENSCCWVHVERIVP